MPNLNSGGSQRVFMTIIRNIDRSKFQVMLAVVDTKKEVFLNQIPSDIKFVDFKCQNVRYSLFKIFTLVWRHQPDIVFSTLSHLNLAIAMIKYFLPGKTKYIARESTIISKNLEIYKFQGLWLGIYGYFYSKFDLIICQSFYMRNDILSALKISNNNTLVIHNPIDLNYIDRVLAVNDTKCACFDNKATSCVNLVASGRLSKEKGFDILIEALSLLPSGKFRLAIIGSGDLKLSLQKLAETCGVSDIVSFEGFQSNPYSWYAAADALIVSSHYEGFPNVVLESLACGTPVISTPAIGGVVEMLNNVNGCVLAEEITAIALAKAIIKWSKMTQKFDYKNTIKPYQVDKIVSQYENAINSL